jgi:modification methylase
MLPDEYSEWQRKVLTECVRVLKPSGSIFYNHKDILFEKMSIPPLFVWDFCVREDLIWNRSCTPTIDKSYFFPIHEHIYWITKDNKCKVKFDRNKIPLQYRKSILSITREMDNKHPAPFPLSLPQLFIEACTDEGDIVLDPFMGSGTTAVAAKNLKRRFIGCELNQRFIDMSLKRLGCENTDVPIYMYALWNA